MGPCQHTAGLQRQGFNSGCRAITALAEIFTKTISALGAQLTTEVRELLAVCLQSMVRVTPLSPRVGTLCQLWVGTASPGDGKAINGAAPAKPQKP
jgi:hypothetical protein